MYTTIDTLEAYNTAVAQQPAALFYFSHEQCNVCKVLKPKVEELIDENFPEVKLFYVDTVKTPEIAAQLSVFAVPTLTICFDGREFYRRSRNIGIDELGREISRPYSMIFE